MHTRCNSFRPEFVIKVVRKIRIYPRRNLCHVEKMRLEGRRRTALVSPRKFTRARKVQEQNSSLVDRGRGKTILMNSTWPFFRKLSPSFFLANYHSPHFSFPPHLVMRSHFVLQQLHYTFRLPLTRELPNILTPALSTFSYRLAPRTSCIFFYSETPWGMILILSRYNGFNRDRVVREVRER